VEKMREEMLYKKFLTPFILLVIAYEWMVSGLDKFLSGQFVQQINEQLTSALQGMQYSFYADILKHVVIPYASVYAVLVEVGEVCVGLAFVIIAIAIFRNKLSKLIINLGIWASLISAFMVLNFFFFQGGAMFLNPGDPFDEGIPIDFILFLMQLGMVIFFFTLHRGYGKVQKNNSVTKGHSGSLANK
jgi:thiosulfate dehydrogenase [quinone] large subunit